ncbi:MAG: bifunctional 2-methylcitrate dehydratase/aconitate hydratase [Candidatus Hodarchaeales archaeon]|jgi:2-methylcitrate dehydratase
MGEEFQPDEEMVEIAKYVKNFKITSQEAYNIARLCLMDSIGCAILALQFPECTKLLGPVIQATTVPNGSRVIGTSYILDPVRAAYNIGTMIRWLDYNDTWLAAEWAHPSDNLGAILAISDHLSRKNESKGLKPISVHDVLTALIKAYEIQGIMALENSFNNRGLDHVILVKLASTAIAADLLGCNEQQIINAISNVWVDLGPLRTYRHWPNTGSRKSWAAGDAASRAVFLAIQAKKGEMGYPTALTAEKWGFYDSIWDGGIFKFPRKYESYVIENILFKVSYPAEFHGQTAVEASIKLHPEVVDRLEDIEKIVIHTQEAGNQIINKIGELRNPADRDHCIQYMCAVGLLFGNLVAEDYEDERAKDPRINNLRKKMAVSENTDFTTDYHDPNKRSIANSLQVIYQDGSSSEPVEVHYPIGHKKRRSEAIPLLKSKFKSNLSQRFKSPLIDELLDLFDDKERIDNLSINSLIDRLIIK